MVFLVNCRLQFAVLEGLPRGGAMAQDVSDHSPAGTLVKPVSEICDRVARQLNRYGPGSASQ